MTDVQQEASPAAGTPAAGWYPDPAQPGQTRWWSGSAWTDHVQAAGVAVAPVPAAPDIPEMPASVVAPARPSNLDANGVPLSLFADSAFDPAVLAPQAGPSTQSEWHARGGSGARPTRTTVGSVSLSTQVPSATSRRHDPYRERNWIAGLALGLAILSAPMLVLSAAWDLPALTRGVFGGAPIAIALLAIAASVRRGGGVITSIVAAAIAGGVVLAGFLLSDDALRGIVETVTGWLA